MSLVNKDRAIKTPNKCYFRCEKSYTRAMADRTPSCYVTGRISITRLLLLAYFIMCLSFCSAASRVDNDSIENQTRSVEDTETTRLAAARLQQTLKNSPIVVEKVAPVVERDSDDATVSVDMKFAIASVLSIDDVKEIMTTSVYVKMSWVDQALSWNVSQHNGVQSVELPVQSVWTPDIYIANSMDKKKLFDYIGVVTVLHNGTVTGNVDHIMNTYCDMRHVKYPYDTQNCPLIIDKFSPILRITLSAYILENTAASGTSYSSSWDLLSQKISRADFYDGNTLALSCEVRRKTTFYTVCLVAPMVMTSIMNTLVFLVPLQSGEKISFLVSIFVSTSVFTSFFTTGMPRGLDSVPKTMKLLIGVMLESLLILLATLLVLTRDDRESSSCGVACPEVRTSYCKEGQAPAEGSASASALSYSHNAPDTVETTAKRSNEVVHASGVPRGSPSCSGLTGSYFNGCLKVTAKRLDRFFFVLAFVGNAVFLSVLLLL